MHVHFLGIGGSGVSGLALMAREMGYAVSGCDENSTPYYKMVSEKGIKCSRGHSSSHLEGVDIVVRSSAVPLDSAEMKAALDKGIKVFTRGEFLSRLMTGKDVIGVAGSHGKTTTTWMIYHILKNCGLNPSVYAGGKSQGVSTVSAGSPYIIELDESDGSVFEIMPGTLVINNLEYEHADFYKSSDEMLNSFERYILAGKPDDLIIGRGFDLSDALFSMFSSESFPKRSELGGNVFWQNSSGLHFFSRNNLVFLLADQSEIFVGSLSDPVHVLQNRSAALMGALSYLRRKNVQLKDFDSVSFWNTIPGIDRRFELVGNYKGYDLIDDYAHHPSELNALIQQAGLKYGNFCLVFQPHRISRFTTFYAQFREVLKNVEPLVILPVYSAGEKMEGADSEMMYRDLKEMGSEVYYFDSVEKAADFIVENSEKLYVHSFVAAGAGDVNHVFAKLEGK